MSLDAGSLRHKVEIQEQVTTTDADGQTDKVWQRVALVWAAVAPMSAKEFVAAQAIQSEVTTRITIRYRAGIKAAMRVLHRGKIYNVQGVLSDRESGLEYLTLPCSEGANAG